MENETECRKERLAVALLVRMQTADLMTHEFIPLYTHETSTPARSSTDGTPQSVNIYTKPFACEARTRNCAHLRLLYYARWWFCKVRMYAPMAYMNGLHPFAYILRVWQCDIEKMFSHTEVVYAHPKSFVMNASAHEFRSRGTGSLHAHRLHCKTFGYVSSLVSRHVQTNSIVLSQSSREECSPSLCCVNSENELQLIYMICVSFKLSLSLSPFFVTLFEIEDIKCKATLQQPDFIANPQPVKCIKYSNLCLYVRVLRTSHDKRSGCGMYMPIKAVS